MVDCRYMHSSDMHSKFISNGLRSPPFLRGLYSNLILSCWAYALLQFSRLEPNAHSLPPHTHNLLLCCNPTTKRRTFPAFPPLICASTLYFTARIYASSPPSWKIFFFCIRGWRRYQERMFHSQPP
ncbi:hypothetical protein K443DRAFT_468347 [Laccaria amethystina LaAM-08-1]|uniref:Uncharacterized protein n=1 Tax=Laccaria amethystina LaAM-08-1 TaxID=1095629 RepID=A0A0C9X2E5_9AGAR|nr:hypothetical protein K443DRAFT_468347 [Laccaria amethystina LaAM-08-1]